jgi:hypothetical protein
MIKMVGFLDMRQLNTFQRNLKGKSLARGVDLCWKMAGERFSFA